MTEKAEGGGAAPTPLTAEMLAERYADHVQDYFAIRNTLRAFGEQERRRAEEDADAVRAALIPFLSGHTSSECAGMGECVCDPAWPLVGLLWGDYEGARHLESRLHASAEPPAGPPAPLAPQDEGGEG